MTDLPAFARGLCDDAAVFPPGLAPLADAVPAHRRHRAAPYAALVGPLVLPATALDQLYPLVTSDPLDLSITAPNGPAQAANAVAAAADLPVVVHAVEVAVPTGMTASDLVHGLELLDVPVYVEVPRDERRPAVIDALAATGHRAKFRTGGVHANLYPAPDELAAGVVAAVRAGVPFKATAGLHHPVRNTDPETGFHQHGFLNLLLATDAAMHGAGPAELTAVLADRDAASIAARIAGLGDARAAFARSRFLSFGTCSITDPLTELAALGLLPSSLLKEDA
ncbi:hypothetical protein [Actinomadura napierensis]|uniref:Dihydrodipicolinate synthase family protein n=1 Tax=Actinomadura napierensis TaxID=267854 RepID=A0ABN3ACH6_9ACTN